jgi:UDP-N-acetylglucosamine 1-carboxyvinyltransferase
MPSLNDEQIRIGSFIKQLREERGLTQAAFAASLKTTQSVVARMESGEQNFTTETLAKISEALRRPILTLSSSLDFRVEGGRQLKGSVTTNCSKNGAMGLLCAALLNKGRTTLHGIPRIEEVHRIIEVLVSIGVSVAWKGQNVVELVPPKKFAMSAINADAAKKTRSVLMMMGPLLHRAGEFRIPQSGGCKMGERTIAAHRFALEELGAKIVTESDAYHVTVPKKKLRPADLVMYEASDTAAENVLMAAALTPGATTIRFAPPNYQVQEVATFLEKLGVRVEGVGSTTMVVHGIADIDQDIEYHNSEDPIESMMFLAAAIVTKSTLLVKRCPIDFLEVELLKLDKMGLKCQRSKPYLAKNGRTRLVDITVKPSKLRALRDKIHAQPYPGINTDNLPFFVSIATQAEGTTLIHDWMWENRAIYFTELNRLGANVVLADPHRAFVHGPTKLRGAQVVCPPALRPAMIILIAMLGAEGTSVLRNVYSIARGYEEIAARLNALGAKIEVLQGV